MNGTKGRYRFLIFVVLVVAMWMTVGEADYSDPPAEDAVISNVPPTGLEGSALNAASNVLAGLVSRMDGTYYFQECDADVSSRYVIRDNTGYVDELFETSIYSETQSIFASLVIQDESNADGEFDAVVTAVNYWPVEGFNCDYPWKSFEFKAFGNEPFWVFEFTNGNAELNRPDASSEKWDLGPAPFPLTSSDGTLEVTVVQAACKDGMSGAQFGNQVAIRANGAFYKGCGMYGVDGTL